MLHEHITFNTKSWNFLCLCVIVYYLYESVHVCVYLHMYVS